MTGTLVTPKDINTQHGIAYLPENNKKYTLEEIKKYIGCRYAQVMYSRKGKPGERLVFFGDEDAKLQAGWQQRINPSATELAKANAAIGEDDCLVGNIFYCKEKHFE